MNTKAGPGIVVGYDGSKNALGALDWAIDEATARALPLTVLHVWNVPVGGPMAMPMADLSGLAEETLEEGVRHAREAAPEVPVHGTLACGQAAAELLKMGGDAQLIVLGPRGLGGFAGLLLGSVSSQVAAHAPCPVVIARGDLRPSADDGPRRVVVGVDGSPASRAALAMAFTEAEAHGLSVHAVVAWEPAPLKNLPPLMDETDILEAAEAGLTRMLAPSRELHPHVTAEAQALAGPPREVLMDAAADARLLVVGSRGTGTFRGLPLGSISRALVEHAPCAVAVVPAQPDAASGD